MSWGVDRYTVEKDIIGMAWEFQRLDSREFHEGRDNTEHKKMFQSVLTEFKHSVIHLQRRRDGMCYYYPASIAGCFDDLWRRYSHYIHYFLPPNEEGKCKHLFWSLHEIETKEVCWDGLYTTDVHHKEARITPKHLDSEHIGYVQLHESFLIEDRFHESQYLLDEIWSEKARSKALRKELVENWKNQNRVSG